MSYNAGITYRYNFKLIVVMTTSTGFVESCRFASKFRKFHDHGLSAVSCCFWLQFRNEAS